MNTVETSPLEDGLARQQLARRRLSSLLVWLSVAVFLADMIITPNFVRAGGPHPRFAGFGMAMTPLMLGLACLVRPAGRFRHAAGILCIGVSFGLALEFVRFPGEHEWGCCPSPINMCIANLKQIEGAKANWALELRKTTNDMPRADDLYGDDCYIRAEPRCPLHGVYVIGRVGATPRCSIAGHSL